MYSEDNLLRRPFLINTGGGGGGEGSPTRLTLALHRIRCAKRLLGAKRKKKLIKEHLEGKLLTSKEEATFDSAGEQ